MNIFALAAAFAADRYTKQLAEKKLKPGEYKNTKFKRLYFYRLNNYGFSGGAFSHSPEIVRGINTVFMLMMLFYSLFFTKEEGKAFKLGLSLTLGGGLSNLYDRYEKGCVTDFICFKKGKSLVYNLADFFIFAGSLLMVFSTIYNNKRP